LTITLQNICIFDSICEHVLSDRVILLVFKLAKLLTCPSLSLSDIFFALGEQNGLSAAYRYFRSSSQHELQY